MGLAHHRIIDEVLRRTVKHDPFRLEYLFPIGDGPKPLNSEPLNPETVNVYMWHMIDSLFEILDVNNDGAISRSDLHVAAKRIR
jgi:hypothetical protein